MARSRWRFWLPGVLALLAIDSAALPVGVIAGDQQRMAQAVDARAHRSQLAEADVAGLEAAVTDQFGALRSFVLTARPALLADYQSSREQARLAWRSLAADGPAGGLSDELSRLKAALDGWQGWAADSLQPSAPTVFSLDLGGRLYARFVSAADRLGGVAARLTAADRAESELLRQRALAASTAAGVAGPGLVLVAGSILLWLALRPVSRLARAANRLAAGLEPAIPHTRRSDEIGTLARALVSWRQAVASQSAAWLHSPIGMLTVGPDFKPRYSNPALIAMFGFRSTDLVRAGRTDVFEATHPDDRAESHRLYRRVIAGEIDYGTLEKRYIHNDGSIFWGSLTLAAIRDADGRPLSYANLIEDISVRKETLARAAQVQRDLLPESAPALEGYDLTGLCQPSEEVGGDFFDWYQPDPGSLVLTLGDVMGKGMPAAILMATMRIALRAASWVPSAREAVQLVADFTLRDLEKAEAFMTLFHARLDLETGRLTYVDAGHGLMVVVSQQGAVRRLPSTHSLPLGMLPDQTYRQTTVRLRPGDSLIAVSDGVLDVHPGLDGELEETTRTLLEGALDARDMAERLATNPSAEITDDVTVVVLRRWPAEHSRRGRQGSLVTLDSQA